MVASIGKIASPAQGVGYFERDGYYARDDGAHREASAWAGRGAAALGLEGPVDPEAFRRVLEGEVPGGRRLGCKELDGSITHRPGRDVTLSAPKSVSVMALVGGDDRIVEAHDKAVTATLGWIEANAVETRMRDPATGAMVRTGDQKMVAATFRHDTSRNLDPQLHIHAVVANMVHGGDGKWRTMVDDGLFNGKMAIGAIYRAELAQGLKGLGYGIDKAHADGRFEIEGVSREVIDAFSTRRAEIEAAMSERGMGESKDNPHLAARAALLTRAAKRDIDRGALERGWKRQAKALGFQAAKVMANARKAERGLLGPDLFAGPGYAAGDAAGWAVGHLSERQSVFGHADLLAATLAREPGAVKIEAAKRAIAALERGGAPSHLFWMGADPLLAAEALGAALFHVHAKDTLLNAPVQATTSLLENGSLMDVPARSWSYVTLGYGHGEEWWRRFCYRLRMAGYDGWLSIEHEDVLLSSIEGLRKSVALLESVMPLAASDSEPQAIREP